MKKIVFWLIIAHAQLALGSAAPSKPTTATAATATSAEAIAVDPTLGATTPTEASTTRTRRAFAKTASHRRVPLLLIGPPVILEEPTASTEPQKSSKIDEIIAEQKRASDAQKDAATQIKPLTPFIVRPASLNGDKRGSIKPKAAAPIFDITDYLRKENPNLEALTTLEKSMTIDYNQRDPKTGETALMIAADKINLELAGYLINTKKVALNEQDNDRNTALHHILKAIIKLKTKKSPRTEAISASAHATAATACESNPAKTIAPSKIVSAQEAELEKARALAQMLIKKIDTIGTDSENKVKKGYGLTLENSKNEAPWDLVTNDNEDNFLITVLVNTQGIRSQHTRESFAVGHDPDSSDDEDNGNKPQQKKIVEKPRKGSAAASAATALATPKISIFKAAEIGDLDTIKIYQTVLKANLNAANNGTEAKTILMIAAENGKRPVVEYLIAQKGKINLLEQDIHGDTALHLALRSEKGLDIVPILINAMTNLEIENKKGDRPLHVAAQTANVSAAELLIGKFVLRKPKNKQQLTPLVIARQKKSDLDITTSLGMALPIAKQAKEMVEYLEGMEAAELIQKK